MTQPILPYTPARVAEIRSWVKDCATWLEARAVIAKRLGVHTDNVTKSHKRHGFWGVEELPGQGPAVNVQQPDVTTTSFADGFDADVELSKAATVEEVIELCKVDTDKWESKGFSVRRGSKGYAWNARFAAKKATLDVAKVAAIFQQHVASHTPRKAVVEKRAKSSVADCCYVLNIHDLHLAKLAWSPETGGAPWDIKIADQTYRDTVDDLIAKAPSDRIEKVVVIVGSDMLQVDNDQSSTTAGTYVDSDSRLPKVFEVAARMMVDTIEKLATRFDVEAMVIPGNHDHSVSFFLGQYLSAWFRTFSRVTINSSPKSRKYIPYGKTLIGFDHGDETPGKDLPLLAMRENQSTINQFRFTEILSGHLHSEQSDDYKGIVVRVAPALCSADKWHSDKGFLGAIRRAQGLLYQRENGLEAIFYSTPLD